MVQRSQSRRTTVGQHLISDVRVSNLFQERHGLHRPRTCRQDVGHHCIPPGLILRMHRQRRDDHLVSLAQLPAIQGGWRPGRRCRWQGNARRAAGWAGWPRSAREAARPRSSAASREAATRKAATRPGRKAPSRRTTTTAWRACAAWPARAAPDRMVRSTTRSCSQGRQRRGGVGRVLCLRLLVLLPAGGQHAAHT